MEPIKIENEDIKKAIESSQPYIQVGTRRFLLLEIEDINNLDCYEVTDPEEEKRLVEALNENNPILSDEEIKKMLED